MSVRFALSGLGSWWASMICAFTGSDVENILYHYSPVNAVGRSDQCDNYDILIAVEKLLTQSPGNTVTIG